MPPPSSKSAISLGELVTCKDFLNNHREYAIKLLSSLENVSQWHRTKGCPETRQGLACILCELCGASGLMGTTKATLAAYDTAEQRLKTVRASLGKNVHGRGALSHMLGRLFSKSALGSAVPCHETLFRNGLARSVFLSIVTAGDTLRSQHAAWQARLQSEVLGSSSSTPGPSELDRNKTRDTLLPTYTDLKVVGSETNPKSTAVSTGSIAETTLGSSTFVVFRRCLSPDCPCELNRANTTNTGPKAICRSQVNSKVRPSLTNPKGMQTSKITAKPGDISDALPKPKTNTQGSNTYHEPSSTNAQVPDKPRLQVTLSEEYTPLNPMSNTALWAQEIEPSPECSALIVDPRVFRLREGIARSADVHRALMAWCRACQCRTDLQVDPRGRHGTTPAGSPTYGPTAKGTRESPFVLACDTEPGKSPCTTGHIGEAPIMVSSHGKETMMAQEQWFDEQEELRGQWLMAQQKRCGDRERRPSRRD